MALQWNFNSVAKRQMVVKVVMMGMIDQMDTGKGLGEEEDSSSFMTSDALIRCG